jgi:hypothetical protein
MFLKILIIMKTTVLQFTYVVTNMCCALYRATHSTDIATELVICLGNVNVTLRRVSMFVLHNLRNFSHKLMFFTFNRPVCENSAGIEQAMVFEMFESNH